MIASLVLWPLLPLCCPHCTADPYEGVALTHKACFFRIQEALCVSWSVTLWLKIEISLWFQHFLDSYMWSKNCNNQCLKSFWNPKSFWRRNHEENISIIYRLSMCLPNNSLHCDELDSNYFPHYPPRQSMSQMITCFNLHIVIYSGTL